MTAMLNAGETLYMVTGSAVSTDVSVSYALDNGVTVLPQAPFRANVSTATTTAIVNAAIPASNIGFIESVSITNRHGSSSQTVQLFVGVGAATYVLSQNLTLLAGQTAYWDRQSGMLAVAMTVAKTSSTPVMDGTAAIGASNTWADGLHVHPTDTSRQAAYNFTLSGTSGQTYTFPSTSDTVACLGTSQTFTQNQVVSRTATETASNTQYVLEASVNANPTSTSDMSNYSMHCFARTSGSQTFNQVLGALKLESFHFGTGTAGYMYAFSISALSRPSSGAVTNMKCAYVPSWGALSGGGTVTNAYAFVSDSLTVSSNVTNAYANYVGSVSGATNNYAFYSNAGIHSFGDVVDFRGSGTTASAANAFLDSGNNNRIYRSTSSIRYKANVNNVTDSSVVYKLRPVTYTSMCEDDDKSKEWYGFIAEEVELVDNRLVHYSKTTDIDKLDFDLDGLCNIEQDSKSIFINWDNADEAVLSRLSFEVLHHEDNTPNHFGNFLPQKQLVESVQYERVVVLLVAEIHKLNERICRLEKGAN